MERIISLILICALLLTGCGTNDGGVSQFTPSFFADLNEKRFDSKTVEAVKYNSSLTFSSVEHFMYEDICFEENDIIPEDSYSFSSFSAVCYDIDDAEILYSKNMFEKVYPASTTKLLTALTAVKYGDINSVCEIAVDDCGITTPGAQLCHFKAGDRLSFEDMLYCLLVFSGNDAAVALAENVSGSEAKFIELMNAVAAEIGANATSFNNTHGLHSPNHYTTAYDIYLIFNECLKQPVLKKIFKSMGYTVNIENLNGETRELYMEPTNLYFTGVYSAPDGINVFGGKTGTTIAAGNCLIIYSENLDGHGFITEIFKAEDKKVLYNEMNQLLLIALKNQ